jgi:hypothetical protein
MLKENFFDFPAFLGFNEVMDGVEFKELDVNQNLRNDQSDSVHNQSDQEQSVIKGKK